MALRRHRPLGRSRVRPGARRLRHRDRCDDEGEPTGTIVVAEIPEIYGPTFTAQMTYYETPTGAKVFAAGAIDFGGTALLPIVSRMLENLWARLSLP